MRIVSGSLKGRKIESPYWKGLRPTSERLRETIFDVLAESIEGTRVLDAFAGTGAVGFEALSRGAAQTVFVDNDENIPVGSELRICLLYTSQSPRAQREYRMPTSA